MEKAWIVVILIVAFAGYYASVHRGKLLSLCSGQADIYEIDAEPLSELAFDEARTRRIWENPDSYFYEGERANHWNMSDIEKTKIIADITHYNAYTLRIKIKNLSTVDLYGASFLVSSPTYDVYANRYDYHPFPVKNLPKGTETTGEILVLLPTSFEGAEMVDGDEPSLTFKVVMNSKSQKDVQCSSTFVYAQSALSIQVRSDQI